MIQIFSETGRTDQPKVVQEVLADLKNCHNSIEEEKKLCNPNMGPLLSTKYNDPVTKYIMMLSVKLHLELY